MPKEKDKLGKSLSDLLQDESLIAKVELLQQDKSSTQQQIPIDQIVANPFQPRQTFNQEKLEELANSIKEHGVLTPILVRRRDDIYQIVAGERRYRASKLAGLTTIPAVVQEFNDQEMGEIALIENIQREDLSPLEEARAYQEMIKTYDYTQQQLATRVGKSRPYIANILRLLNLPTKVQSTLENHKLSVGHVRTLVGLKEDEALFYIEKIVNGGLSVRETERLVNKKKPTKRRISEKERQEKALREKLNAPVQVAKGEIKIRYKNKQDLEKIIKELLK